MTSDEEKLRILRGVSPATDQQPLESMDLLSLLDEKTRQLEAMEQKLLSIMEYVMAMAKPLDRLDAKMEEALDVLIARFKRS